MYSLILREYMKALAKEHKERKTQLSSFHRKVFEDLQKHCDLLLQFSVMHNVEKYVLVKSAEGPEYPQTVIVPEIGFETPWYGILDDVSDMVQYLSTWPYNLSRDPIIEDLRTNLRPAHEEGKNWAEEIKKAERDSTRTAPRDLFFQSTPVAQQPNPITSNKASGAEEAPPAASYR